MITSEGRTTGSTPPSGWEPADLLIIGGSVRSAATSARRAGLTVIAADRFADRDLVAICPAIRVSRDWSQLLPLVSAAERPIARQWIYTGGLENYPDVVANLASRLPLIGNDRDVLRLVRDPQWLGARFHQAGIPFPETVASECWSISARSSLGPWLRKPRKSCGGRSIAWTDPRAAHAVSHTNDDQFWYQRFVPGESQAAVYLASDGECRLLGVTRQLIGQYWLGAQPFQYCGSLGPLPLSPSAEFAWQAIGRTLVEACQLSGLFGVDAVVDAGGAIWPVEVNPRYTASVEVLERALDISAIQLHVDLQQGRPQPSRRVSSRHWFGKAIVYAPCDLVVPEPLIDYLDRTNRWAPDALYADLPWPEQVLRAGEPVLTILASGPDVQSVSHQLRRRVEWLWAYVR